MARTIRKAAWLAITVCALCLSSFASEPALADTQLHLDRGFRQMYNRDFPAAHDTFHQYQQAHPQDPMGYTANAAASVL